MMDGKWGIGMDGQQAKICRRMELGGYVAPTIGPNELDFTLSLLQYVGNTCLA